MSEPSSSQPVASTALGFPSAPAVAEIDASCRVPLLVLFVSAAVWLVIGSCFALISSIKFHSPNFLADCAGLTYGRVRPAYFNSLLYGFCIQAGLGVGLWLLARLGRTLLVQSWLITVGASLWNLGVTIGVLGILAGDTTGFDNFEMPGYSSPMVFLGYLMIGFWGLLTFHRRKQRSLFVSQCFFFAALFWFPWIYSTAELLLVTFPVRGVTQSVIAWWYSQNLQVVWLSLVGLAAVFYLVPKLLNRELHSRYLALFTFWVLILFGGWGGIPNSAPVPAWMPALSTVGAVLTVLALLTFAVNYYQTIGSSSVAPPSSGDSKDARGRRSAGLAPFRFVAFGSVAFLVAGSMRILAAFPFASRIVEQTWFDSAQAQLHAYGFFAMVTFGAIYYIIPLLTGMELPSTALVRAHFALAGLGILLIFLPLGIAGVVEGYKLLDRANAPMDVFKATVPFLRVSTMGDLLLALGHIAFLANLIGLVVRYSRAQAASALASITAEISTSGAKP